MIRLADLYLAGGCVTRVGFKKIRSLVLISLVPLCAGCFSTAQSDANAASDGDGFAEMARCIVPDDADRIADQVLQLLNLERAEAGLKPVVVNPDLQKLADDFACRMIVADFFGHTDPQSGEGPGDRARGKYAYRAIGENLAAGQPTPAEVMRVWMESPAHREIILDEKWTEVGLSVRHGGQYAIYWVQEFGLPADE